MTTFFLTCALVGGVLLIAQLVGGALGAEHDTAMHDGAVGSALDGALTHLHQTAHETSGGLQLLSVRALTAAVAFFGIGGLGAISLGAATPLVIIAAALLGASTRPALAAIPLVAGLPVGLGWLKLQGRLKRDLRLEKLPGTQPPAGPDSAAG